MLSIAFISGVSSSFVVNSAEGEGGNQSNTNEEVLALMKELLRESEKQEKEIAQLKKMVESQGGTPVLATVAYILVIIASLAVIAVIGKVVYIYFRNRAEINKVLKEVKDLLKKWNGNEKLPLDEKILKILLDGNKNSDAMLDKLKRIKEALGQKNSKDVLPTLIKSFVGEKAGKLVENIFTALSAEDKSEILPNLITALVDKEGKLAENYKAVVDILRSIELPKNEDGKNSNLADNINKVIDALSQKDPKNVLPTLIKSFVGEGAGELVENIFAALNTKDKSEILPNLITALVDEDGNLAKNYKAVVGILKNIKLPENGKNENSNLADNINKVIGALSQKNSEDVLLFFIKSFVSKDVATMFKNIIESVKDSKDLNPLVQEIFKLLKADKIQFLYNHGDLLVKKFSMLKAADLWDLATKGWIHSVIASLEMDINGVVDRSKDPFLIAVLKQKNADVVNEYLSVQQEILSAHDNNGSPLEVNREQGTAIGKLLNNKKYDKENLMFCTNRLQIIYN